MKVIKLTQTKPTPFKLCKFSTCISMETKAWTTRFLNLK
jgi:hypothetical protein